MFLRLALFDMFALFDAVGVQPIMLPVATRRLMPIKVFISVSLFYLDSDPKLIFRLNR